MRISVLGPVTLPEAEATASLAPRDRVVLAVLVTNRGRAVSAETLADALWGEHLPASWAKVLQGCVVRLRRSLGGEAIQTRAGGGYALVVPAEEIDSFRFERLVAQARELLVVDEPDRSTYAVDAALSLWRGEPFPELENWDPGHAEAERLRALRLDAEELRIEAALAAGRSAEVLSEAQLRVTEQPLRETRWGLHARALYQAGRQAEALRTLRLAGQVMRRELGLEPGPELVDLEQSILRQDARLLSDPLGHASAVCPYQGLVPYDVGDADTFFGREREIADCLTRLRVSGVLAVVGASGSGKSSLVRAGVVPALERDATRVVVITPGPHPLQALTAVPRDGTVPALVIDQCEEVVTLCQDPDERADFFDAVLGHAESAYVVVTLRADRLGELSEHPAFASLVERGLYLLRRMDREQLREAIVSPAKQAGLVLQHGLVDLLVRDVEGEPGSLPLLSHALQQTWLNREGSTLTTAGYLASGGIRGAVAQSAERVYEGTPTELRPALRDLLLRLVVPGSSADAPVRARVPRHLVAPDPTRGSLVETLLGARLLTSDEDVIEIAHESLAVAWPRLQAWLADDVDGQLIRHHLAGAAEAWEKLGRPESELYRGVRLARARESATAGGHELTRSEADFLAASEEVHRTDQERTRLEMVRQRRINRRLRVVTAGAGALALVTASLGGLALLERSRADAAAELAQAEADRADSEAAVARSHELASAATAALDTDPGLAKLLAVSAALAAPIGLQALAALHRAWAADPIVGRPTFLHELGRLSAELHPEGDRIVMTGDWPGEGTSSALEVQDPRTGDLLWSYSPAESHANRSLGVARAAYTPDGSRLVAGVQWLPAASWVMRGEDEDRAEAPEGSTGIYVWDADSHELERTFDVGACGGRLIEATSTHIVANTMPPPCDWSPEGDRDLVLVEQATGDVRVLATGVSNLYGAAALSADGRFVAAENGLDDVEVAVWDLRTDEEVGRYPAPHLRAISGDGTLVVTGGLPLEVRDARTGEVLTEFNGHTEGAVHVRFAPDGQSVWSTGNDGTLRQWDPSSGQELRSVTAMPAGAVSVTTSGLVSVADVVGSAAVVLDTGLRGEAGVLPGCTSGRTYMDTVRAVEGDPLVACQGDDTGSILRGELTEGVVEPVATLWGIPMEVSPDGRRLAANTLEGVDGGTLVTGPGILDLRDGTVLQLEGTCTWDYQEVSYQDVCATYPEEPFAFLPTRMRWSPDGGLVAASRNHLPFSVDVAVWDTRTGDLVFADAVDGPPEVTDVDEPVDIIFTPDGAELLVSTRAGEIVRVAAGGDWELAGDPVVPGVDGQWFLGLVGFAAGAEEVVTVGSYLEGLGADGSLHVLDARTLRPVRSRLTIHEGVVVGAALDPGGARVATAGAEGSVRIWDLATLGLVHDIPFDGVEVAGLAWLDREHLAVGLSDGEVRVVTTDPEELLALTRSSLTRGFTASECERYGFAADCPTLGELRGENEVADPELVGSWAMDWSVPDLVATMTAGSEQDVAGPLDSASVEELELLAGDFLREATGVRLTLEESGAYQITRPGEPLALCEGSYTVASGRIRLGAERGEWCSPTVYFEADYEVVDDELSFGVDGFRAPFYDRYAWASRPLARVG